MTEAINNDNSISREGPKNFNEALNEEERKRWELPIYKSSTAPADTTTTTSLYTTTSSYRPTWTDDSSFITTTAKPLTGAEIVRLPINIAEERKKIEAHRDHWIQKFQLETVSVSHLGQPNYCSSGTYFVGKGDPEHVIKPVDEDIFCMNNPIKPDFPGTTHRVRPDIPLYHSVERECAAYEISKILKLPVVPPTRMAAVESPAFYDVLLSFKTGPWKKLLEKVCPQTEEILANSGTRSTLKLCSWRPYVAHSTTLSQFMERHEEKLKFVDPRDIIAVNLLMWAFGNSDGHSGNVLVYLKGVTPDGNPVYGLQMIDLCLTFPEKNKILRNAVPDIFTETTHMPGWAMEWIRQFPLEPCIDILKKYELDDAVPAFQERIGLLKHWMEESASMEEINKRFARLNPPNGIYIPTFVYACDFTTKTKTSSTTRFTTSISSLIWLRA